MGVTDIKSYWDDKRKKIAQAKENGHVIITVSPQGTIHVVCPEDSEFAVRAKELGGRYKHRTGVWTFPFRARRLVRELAIERFGEEAIQ